MDLIKVLYTQSGHWNFCGIEMLMELKIFFKEATVKRSSSSKLQRLERGYLLFCNKYIVLCDDIQNWIQ